MSWITDIDLAKSGKFLVGHDLLEEDEVLHDDVSVVMQQVYLSDYSHCLEVEDAWIVDKKGEFFECRGIRAGSYQELAEEFNRIYG